MHLPHVVRFLLGSVAVYVAMAACSSSDSNLFGSSSTGGHGGMAALTSGAGGSSGSLMNPVPNAFADSGSRLRVRWIVGTDGSKVYHSMWDSARNEACWFGMMSDGKLHCMPSAGSATGGFYFADASCSIPAAVSTTCQVVKYALTSDAGCAGANHLFAIGPMVASVYLKSGAQCVASPLSGNQTAYSVGAEIPPSAFVDGSVVTE